MSLEKALQENTATMERLIAALEAARTTGCEGSTDAQVEHPIARGTPAEMVAVTASTDAIVFPANAATLTFDEVRKAFLKLVTADRDRAVALLAKYGFKKLTPEALPESKYAEFYSEVVNG